MLDIERSKKGGGAKVDNQVNKTDQTPTELNLMFVSLHNEWGFFLNKDKRLKAFRGEKEKQDVYEFRLTQENFSILDGFSRQ